MNRVCEALGIEKPFIQGAMSWITNAEFVAAVSNAGGLGILGPNAGQTELTPDPVETAERMRREIRKTREMTEKPFAVTLIGNGNSTSVFTMKILDVVIDEKVPVVIINSYGFPGMLGIDKDLLKPLKENKIKMVVRSILPSVEDAKVVEEQGADVYVATGFDEGGTLPPRIIGSFSILPMIKDAIHIPICLAGGIADVRTANAAFVLGAEGIYVGTRLLCTDECPVAPNVKELIARSGATDLEIFRVAPSYYRSLPTKLRDKLMENEHSLNRDQTYEANKKLMGGTGGMRIGMLEGDLENGYVSVGNGVSLFDKIMPVKDVVDELLSGYNEGMIKFS